MSYLMLANRSPHKLVTWVSEQELAPGRLGFRTTSAECSGPQARRWLGAEWNILQAKPAGDLALFTCSRRGGSWFLFMWPLLLIQSLPRLKAGLVVPSFTTPGRWSKTPMWKLQDCF